MRGVVGVGLWRGGRLGCVVEGEGGGGESVEVGGGGEAVVGGY